MPKRSAQSRIEKYARKIRKIEEKEKKKRRKKEIISTSDSSDDEDNGDHGNACDAIPDDLSMLESTPVAPDITQKGEPISHDNLEQNENLTEPGIHEEATASVLSDLDPDILAALGESTSDSPEYGKNIHENLSQLWLPLLRKGMPKENKDKLLKDYLIPDNCRLLQAPKLNAEISAAIPDMVRNRDKSLTASQQQLGSGISAINRGIDLLLKSNNKVQAMKHLNNGCRLFCDSHYLATQSRIKLISPSLDKSFLHNMISESERDDSLFGSTLSEKIKAAKAIEKQGLSIKKPAKPQKTTAQLSSSRSTSYQGNWNAPPRYQANRGGRGSYNRRPTTSGARRPYTASVHQPQRAATQPKPAAPAQNHR